MWIFEPWGPDPEGSSKPYEFIGFGAINVTKPYEFIWLGGVHGPYPINS